MKTPAVSMGQLGALCALADEGSFTAAARRLGISQPAVTQHVRNLSRAFGAPLVEMSGQRALLTEAGRFAAERARDVLRGIEQLQLDMHEFARARTGTLRLGATLTIGTYVVPELLAAFRAQRPDVEADVRIANTSAVAAMLRSHELALGLVEGVVTDPGIVTVPFREDELVLIAPERFEALAAAEIDPQDLNGVPFVSRERGSGTRVLGYDALVEAGAAPRIVVELPSGEAIVRAVEAGLGVAVLSRLVVEREAARGAIRIVGIRGLRMRRSLFLAAARGRTLSPLQRAFAGIVLPGAKGTAALEAALFGRRSRA